MIIEEFLRQIDLCSILIDDEYEFETNCDEFTHVDGEEGDHGKIKYIHEGKLVGIRHIFGGDDEDWSFTSYGNSLLCEVAKKRLTAELKRLES